MARQEIRKGDHVKVFRTKLETGALVAKEIIVQGPEGPEHEGGTTHHGQ